jgi:hypothetical protein
MESHTATGMEVTKNTTSGTGSRNVASLVAQPLAILLV